MSRISVAVALTLCVAGCRLNFENALCETDDNCPRDQVCSAAGLCVKGTRTDAGTGRDGGKPDAGDAGNTQDAGMDAGDPGTPVLHVDPAVRNFGNVTVNNTSVVAAFTVSNTGSGSTGAITPTLLGTDSALFTVTSTDCPSTGVGATETCLVNVTFAPVAAGPFTATLSIAAARGGTVTAALTGSGVSQGALTISPNVQDFGMVVTGSSSGVQTFTISNTGGSVTGTISTSLTGTDASLFTVVTDGCDTKTLSSTSTCQLTVKFSPGTDTGAKSAAVEITATPGGTAIAQLTGQGLAPSNLTVDPDTLSFADTLTGAVSASKQLTVRNTGGSSTGTLNTVLSGTNQTDFRIMAQTCVGTALSSMATCTIDVQFAPQTSGPKQAGLSITDGAGGTIAPQLAGNALSVAHLTLTTSQGFGSVATGTNTTANLTVTNSGAVATGMVTFAFTGPDAALFSVTANTCPMVGLMPSASCTVTVQFAPTSTGAKSATLTASATPGGSATSALSATGVVPGALSISPGSKDFGPLQVNQTTGFTTFTITNTGQSTTGVPSVSIGTTTQFTLGTSTCTAALGPSASCTVDVKFTPTTSGSQSGFLTVTASPGGSTQASLSGVGQSVASLSLNPTSFAFPSTVIGGTSGTQTFTLSNAGDIASGTLMFAAPSSSFQVAVNNCGGQLGGHASCTISIAFTPMSAGMLSSVMTFSATPGGSAPASLTGTGLSPAALTLAPDATSSVNFGNVTVGSNDTETYVLTNTGAQTSGALSITLSGSDASNYSVLGGVALDCMAGQPLVGGGTCNVRVKAAPTVRGTRVATLTVSATPGSSPSLGLSMTAQDPTVLTLAPTSGSSTDFGTLMVNGTGTQSYTVTNTGDQTSGVITPSLLGTDAMMFSILTGNPTDCSTVMTLGMAQTCVVRVSLTPTSRGVKNASLKVTASPGNTLMLSLTGNAQAPATLTITPATSADFGGVLVTSNTPLIFAVTNTGDQTSGVVTSNMTGTDAAMFVITGNASADCSLASTGLTAGASCNIRIRFTPSSRGTKTATLNVSATPGGMATQAVTGNGLAPAALALAAKTGSSTAFGSVSVGGNSIQTFVLSNTGDQPSSSLSNVTSGADAALFVIQTGQAGDCTTAALAGGASCELRVKFSPIASGMKTTTLRSTATTGGAPQLTLTGTGSTGAVLSGAPSKDFGSLEVGVASTQYDWVITNTGDTTTGVPTLMTVGTEAGITNGCTAALAPAATCTISIIFTASAAGSRTGTLTLTATPGGSVTLALTAIGKWRLTIATTGAGTGTVATSDGTLTPCSPSCTGLFADGTMLTVQARTTNGSDQRFQQWVAPSPANCLGAKTYLVGHNCPITITASTSVTASFAPVTGNLAFVSSTTMTGALGGLTGADATCNTLATAAGINNAGGTAYVAWLSSSSTTAASRLIATGGFGRMDGVPFALTRAKLVTGSILSPLNIDENGKRVTANDSAFTGSDGAGAFKSNDCLEWASTTSDTFPGRVQGGPGLWTAAATTSACTVAQHLYCFENTSTTALTAPVIPGTSKIAYVANGVGGFLPTSGLSGADTFCNANKPAAYAGRSFVAFLAVTGASAGSRIAVGSLTTAYSRPDGISLGLGSDLAAGNIPDGLWVRSDLTYAPGTVNVWTGAASVTAVSASNAESCTNWTSAVGSGIFGSENIGGLVPNWFNDSSGTCSAQPIYCVEP